MVQYDPSIIQAMADKLYAQARFIEIVWALVGLALLGGIGAAGGAAIDDSMTMVAGGIGAVLGAIGGFNHGRAKAFTLRLTAQTALCQVQIEKNTSAAASPGAA